MILLLCRRAAVAGLHCPLPSASNVLSEYFQSVWGSHFCVYCQVSPNVLPSTFNLSGGVTSVFAAKCLLMYCQSTFNLPGGVTSAFCSSRALISSAKSFIGSCCFWTELCVDPAPVQESSSRRAALSAAKCFQCTVRVPRSVWGSHFLCLLPSASYCTAKYLQSVWGVTSVSVAKYLLESCLQFLSRSYFCLSNLSALLLVFLHTSILFKTV